jgi:hypothetical protein
VGLRALRRWLAGGPPHARRFEGDGSLGPPLARLRHGAFRAEALLRVFYVYPVYWFASRLHELRPLLDPQAADFRWPVAWLNLVDPATFAPLVLAFGFATALLGALLPEKRAVRALVFLGLLEVLALKFSFGKIHHLMHGWLFSTFLFVWLPDRAFDAHRASRTDRQSTLLVFSAAQFAVAMTYSLAGLGKVLGTIYQATVGQITPLHPTALARHLADRILQTHADSLLGPWMIEHAYALWPLMLGTMYLQLFAVCAALRPRLHRLWGFGLLGFHATSVLSLTIDFNPNIMLLGVLYLASPFAPPSWDIPKTLRALPGAGWLSRVRRESRPAESADRA